MKRSRIALVGLAIVLVLLAGLFAWQASVLADPLAAPQGSNPNAPLATPQPLSSYQRIQNLDPVAASTMTVTVYSTAGVVQGSATTSSNPYRSALVDERSCCGVGSGFAGSGVVNATTDIAAVTMLVSGGAGTSSFRADSYTSVPGPSVYTGPQLFPIVQKGITSGLTQVTSTLAIQNAGGVSGDFYITYGSRTNPDACAGLAPGSTVLLIRSSIAPNATTFLDLSATGNSTMDSCPRLNGAVSITGTQPFASVAYVGGDGQLFMTSGLVSSSGPSPVDAGSRIVVPLVSKYSPSGSRYESTGISMQTQDGSTQNVTITLIAKNASGGGCVPGTVITATRTLNPAKGFNMLNAPEMVCSFFFGSATIDAPVPIVAVYQSGITGDNTGVDQNNYGVSQSKGIPAGVGTTALYAPHVVLNAQYPVADGVTWSSTGLSISANMPSSSVFSGLVYCNYYIDAGWNSNGANPPAVFQYSKPISNSSPRVGCNTANPEVSAAGYLTFTGSAYVTATNSIVIVANANQGVVSVGPGDGRSSYATVNR